LPFYKEIYRHNNKYGIPDTSKCVNVAKKGHELCKEFGLPDRVPRYLGNSRTWLGIPNNLRVAETLYEIAYMIEFVHGQGWNKAQPYKKAAQAMEAFDKDVSTISVEEIKRIPMVGATIAKLVQEILEKGTCEMREQLY